ncbi:MAG: basic amino acid ABC transporter substrate-binding protein [Firmicutes bacterium]|nr:basic amino acid ABC transporter substrate-binding protein [Bacillota bacterium]
MKKFMKTAIIAAMSIVMALGIAFATTGCGSNGEFIAAMEPTFPPFDTTDEESGDLTGFDYDLLNAIAEDQNFTVTWENMEFDGLIPAIQAGNIDIAASGLSITDERKEQVDFSDEYYISGLIVAVAKSNKDVKSVDDLDKDCVVGAQIGTTGAKKANALRKSGQIKHVKTYNGLDVAFKDLQNGTIDAIINDKPVTEEYVSKAPDDLKIVGEALDSDPFGIAVKKDNKELLDMINAGFANIKENGKYKEICDKWNVVGVE